MKTTLETNYIYRETIMVLFTELDKVKLSCVCLCLSGEPVLFCIYV